MSVIGVVQERSSLIPPYIFETLVVVVITFLLKPLVVASVYRIDGKTGVAGGSEWFRPWVPRAVDILAVSALGVVVADEEERWSPLVFKVLGGLMLLSGLVAGWGDESLRVRLWATFLRYPARIVKTLTISVVPVVALLILGVIGCINYFTPFTSIALYITQGCLFFADEEVNVVNNKAMGLIVTTLIATEQVITASCGGHSVPLWGHWLSVVRMVAIIPPVLVTVCGIVGVAFVFLSLVVISVPIPVLLIGTWSVGSRWRSPRRTEGGGCHRGSTNSPFRFMATLGDTPGVSEVERPCDVGSHLKLWGGATNSK